MNLIQFVAMKPHQGPVFIDGMVNSSEVIVHSKTNSVEGRPKSVVVPEIIDAEAQLILQTANHVIYREMETTLGISGTSIHSKNLFALDFTQFVNRSKKSVNESSKSASTIGSNTCESV